MLPFYWKYLTLTLAGTWYPDKTTSSSKNLARTVILGVSLNTKITIKLFYCECTYDPLPRVSWLQRVKADRAKTVEM